MESASCRRLVRRVEMVFPVVDRPVREMDRQILFVRFRYNVKGLGWVPHGTHSALLLEP